MKIFLSFICFILLVISSKIKKIELENIENKNTDNYDPLNMSLPLETNLKFTIENNLLSKPSKIIFLINGKEIIRCLTNENNMSDNELEKKNYTKISDFDDFQQDFEDYFQLKSYFVKLNKYKEENFICKGVKIDQFLYRSQFIYKLDEINKLLYSEFELENFLDKTNNFSLQLNFHANTLEYFSLSIKSYKSQNKIKLNLDYLNENKNNEFIVLIPKLNKKNIFKTNQNGIEKNELSLNFAQYDFKFKKKVFGSGLHQNILNNLQIKGDRNLINNEQCEISIYEHLEDNTYIDYEEFIYNPIYNIHTFTTIDIEKPSSVSKQHVFLMKYKLKENEIVKNSDQFSINLNITYPIHFRYRSPNDELQYKISKINSDPLFYLNCFNESFFHNEIHSYFPDLLIKNNINNKMIRLNDFNYLNTLNASIPVGNSKILNFVLITTLVLTIGFAIHISKLIIFKKQV